MLREAFEPFVLCLRKMAEENLFTDLLTEADLKMFPLFTPLALLRPLKVLFIPVAQDPHITP
jgi:hypothetical protein